MILRVPHEVPAHFAVGFSSLAATATTNTMTGVKAFSIWINATDRCR
jgi:hypothetical protein